jgi:hypothetical protein
VNFANIKEKRLFFAGNVSKNGIFQKIPTVEMLIVVPKASINYSKMQRPKKYGQQKMFRSGEHAFNVRQQSNIQRNASI